MRYIFVFLLIITSLQCLGQALKAVVMDNEDASVIANAIITNISFGKSVSSEDSGQYELPAHYGNRISVRII